MKVIGKHCVAADITDISKVEMKQLLEQYFLDEPPEQPPEAVGPIKEMIFAWFNLMGQVMGNLELVALRAKQGDLTDPTSGAESDLQAASNKFRRRRGIPKKS